MELVIRRNYDYDHELGYTIEDIEIDKEDIEIHNDKIIINIYER